MSGSNGVNGRHVPKVVMEARKWEFEIARVHVKTEIHLSQRNATLKNVLLLTWEVISSSYLIVLWFMFNFLAGFLSGDLDDVCGRPIENNVPRIEVTIDPDNNPSGTWPWMGSIGYYSNSENWVHKCGSSLITKEYALTAAHCKPDSTKYAFLNRWLMYETIR